jgi:hypothetical protein
MGIEIIAKDKLSYLHRDAKKKLHYNNNNNAVIIHLKYFAKNHQSCKERKKEARKNS